VYDDNLAEKARVQKFIDSNYLYFSGSSFFETELRELNELCSTSWEAAHTWLFNKFKAILELQLTFVAIKAVA
jgi:hypothetical protein